MLHACAARFDVTENLKIFAIFFGTNQGLSVCRIKLKFLYEPHTCLISDANEACTIMFTETRAWR